MIILSIDSGLEKTGYAIFAKDKKYESGYSYIHSDLILTSKKETREKRMHKLYKDLLQVISKFKPDLLILEELFFFKNLKTAIVVSQAQGAILLLAGQKKIPVEFMTPLQIKQVITGYGRADKKSVQKMLKMTLKLDHEFKNDDVADAVACGLAYCFLHR